MTHSFTNANDGSVVLAGALVGTISYTGLEPVTDNLLADDRVFTFNGGAETIALTDAAGASMTIDSTLGESVTFANPTSSLTINAGTGNDIVTITSVDAAYRAALTISGDADADTINPNASLLLGSTTSTGNLSFTAETINLAANIATDGDTTNNDAGSVNLSGAVVLGGNTAIDTNAATSDGNVTFAGTVNADDSTANNRVLAVDSGTATVQFQSTVGVGASGSLADLDVTAGLIRLGGNVTVDDQGGNTIAFNGPVQLVANLVRIDVDAASGPDNNLHFGSTVDADDAVANSRVLFVIGGVGTTRFTAAIGSLQPLAGFSVGDVGGLLRLGGNVIVTDGTGIQDIVILPNVQLDADVTILTDGPAGDFNVFFSGSVNADNAAANDRRLTIDTGIAFVNFLSGSSIGGLQPLAGLDITGGDIGFGSSTTVTDGAGALNVTSRVNNATIFVVLGPISASGPANLTADKMRIEAALSTPGQIVTLKPFNNDAINLGSTVDTTVNTLELSDAELDRVTAGTLRIGESASGPIAISATIDTANTSRMHLRTGGAVTGFSGLNLVESELAISAAGNVFSTIGPEHDVGTLAIASTSGLSVDFKDVNSLTIGSVDGIVGGSSPAGNFSLRTVSRPGRECTRRGRWWRGLLPGRHGR